MATAEQLAAQLDAFRAEALQRQQDWEAATAVGPQPAITSRLQHCK